MPREYRQIDGTLHNVADRIVQDYENSFGTCDSHVGSFAVSRLKTKLSMNLWQTLGFTEDTLTIPMPDLVMSNYNALSEVWKKLKFFGVRAGYDFKGNYVDLETANAYLKGNKERLELTDYDSIQAYERELCHEHGKMWVHSAFISVFEDTDNFHTNGTKVLGMKVSKILSRYAEKFLPGISEEYALALSAKKILQLHLTIDPNIMINCSESGTFSSCFRHDGEYHYSAQRFANSGNCAMVVSFDQQGRIHARQWAFIGDELKGLLLFPLYSSIYSPDMDGLFTKGVTSFVFGEREYKNVDTPNIDCTDESYIDGYYAFSIDNEWVDSSISLGDAIDVRHGDVTWECQVNNYYCECCDENCDEEPTYVESYGSVCDYCLSHNFSWSEYRDDYVDNEVSITDGHGNVYHECDFTFEEHGVTGEYYKVTELTETEDCGYVLEDEAHYSDLLDSYYYDRDTLQEAEEEAKEEA